MTEGNEQSNGKHVHYGTISLPIVLAPLLHAAMRADPCLVLEEAPVRVSFALEALNCLDCLCPWGEARAFHNCPVVARFVCSNFRLHCVDKQVRVLLLHSFMVSEYLI